MGIATVLAPAERDAYIENGDQLKQPEFHRRYALHPEIKKAELIEGTVYMASPASAQHGEPHAELIFWLKTYANAHPELGLRIYDNTTFIIDDENEHQPDILVRRSLQVPDGSIVDKYIYGSPSLIVEVAATSASIDLGPKKKVYARAGVSEYVVYRSLDREADWFDLHDGDFRRITANADGRLESTQYPGLVFPSSLLGH